MMLIQIHHQSRNENGQPEENYMVAQKDIDSFQELNLFCEEVLQSHPLPDGYVFMICNQESEYFTWAVKE